MAPGTLSWSATAGADTTTGPVARAAGLRRAYGHRVVLDDLEIEIARSEIVAMIGRSGSGKSTLLRALAGLDGDVQGELSVAGSVAVAFQEPRLIPWKRVLANVALGLRDRAPREVSRAALAEVGLTDHADAWPLTLSGGEAQRVSLARALVRDPDLLLLDEPFGALDALTRMAMHDLVLGLWERHRPAILLVTHDVDEALALADRVFVLSDGRIAHQALVRHARPRDRDHVDLVELRRELLGQLGIDRKA